MLGPLLVTVIVYESGPPAATGSAESVFVMDRLEDPVMVVPSVALLSPGTGSPSLADTVAVLLTGPPSDGAVTEIVMAGAAAIPMFALLQVTTPLR